MSRTHKTSCYQHHHPKDAYLYSLRDKSPNVLGSWIGHSIFGGVFKHHMVTFGRQELSLLMTTMAVASSHHFACNFACVLSW